MPDRSSVTSLAVFLMLLVVFSGALTALAIATESGPAPVLLLMWSVGLAAMAALKLSRRPLSELGWPWGPARYHLIAFALPLGYCVLGYGVAAVAGLATFPEPAKPETFVQSLHLSFFPAPLGFLAALALLASAGLLQSMTSALGEEIGWRGFLAPRLTAMSGFLFGTLLTGALWAAWHMPLILFTDYSGGGDTRFEVASFAVAVLAISGPMAWLRLNARSLWPCATLHASHNLFVQNIFDPLTARGTSEITMVGEFGVVFAGTVLLTSLPFWIMGSSRRIEPAAEDAQEALVA